MWNYRAKIKTNIKKSSVMHLGAFFSFSTSHFVLGDLCAMLILYRSAVFISALSRRDIIWVLYVIMIRTKLKVRKIYYLHYNMQF